MKVSIFGILRIYFLKYEAIEATFLLIYNYNIVNESNTVFSIYCTSFIL